MLAEKQPLQVFYKNACNSIKKETSTQMFPIFSEYLFSRISLGNYLCCEREQKSGLATILGNMEYLKTDCVVKKFERKIVRGSKGKCSEN